jgi:hypothetical protein
MLLNDNNPIKALRLLEDDLESTECEEDSFEYSFLCGGSCKDVLIFPFDNISSIIEDIF